MKRLLIPAGIGAAMALIFAVYSVADADAGQLVNYELRREPWQAVSSLTAQAAYNGGIWTGWILMGEFSDVCFEFSNDYTGNTGIKFRCEGSDDKTTSADAGADIHACDIASGTVQCSQASFERTFGAADGIGVICVDDVPYQYINCKFDDEAGANATDDLTVRYSRQM